jgi:Trypsin
MKILSLVLAIGLCACVSAQGQESSVHQFPFFVKLISGTVRCGGSLISRRAILTLNQCLVGTTTEIILGGHDFANRHEPTQVRFTVGADTYRRDSLIAIIRFTPQIAFTNEAVNIVSMPFSTPGEEFSGAAASGVGFLASRSTPDIMRFMEVNTITNDVCRRTHPNIHDDFICTAAGSDVCNLSLGAPLVIQSGNNFNQIGIFAFPEFNCVTNQPSAFVRVTRFITFIRTHM